MNAGRPSAIWIVADALRRLRRPLAPTAVAVLIAFSATVTVFATTGQALASQQRAVERINSPSGRLITITDQQGDAGLSSASVEVVQSVTGVEWAFAIGPAVDVQNAHLDGGEVVPARRFYGELPSTVELDVDGGLAPGQAITGPHLADVLGLGTGTGAVDARTLDAVVVGSFRAGEPIAALNDVVLVAPESNDTENRVITLWVSVRDVSELTSVTQTVTSVLVAGHPGALQIETTPELASLSSDLVEEMAHNARLTVTGLLLAVAVLISAVQYGRVAATTREIGRRRALGASRSDITVHVVLTAGACAALGAVLGTGAGLVIDAVVAGALPGLPFTAAVGTLVVLTALAGSIPAALRAARLDPVAILRVP